MIARGIDVCEWEFGKKRQLGFWDYEERLELHTKSGDPLVKLLVVVVVYVVLVLPVRLVVLLWLSTLPLA